MLAALTVRDIVLIEAGGARLCAGPQCADRRDRRRQIHLARSLGTGRGRARGRAERADGRGARLRHRHLRSAASAMWRRCWPQRTAIPATARSMLRRALSADGHTRAFINDEAVGVGLLSELGVHAAGSAWPGRRSRLVRYRHPSQASRRFRRSGRPCERDSGALRRPRDRARCGSGARAVPHAASAERGRLCPRTRRRNCPIFEPEAGRRGTARVGERALLMNAGTHRRRRVCRHRCAGRATAARKRRWRRRIKRCPA